MPCMASGMLVIRIKDAGAVMKRLFFAAAMIFPVACSAQTLMKDKFACQTSEQFDQLYSAIAQDDKRGMRHMLENGCLFTSREADVSILDRTWTGKTKVRVYIGNDAAVLWTDANSIREQ